MPPELPIDEDYASDEDSDFAPDAAPAEGASDASESEEEESNDQPRAATTQKRKRTSGEDGAATAADNDDGFENSGDEAIIQKAKKRKRRMKQKDGAAAAAAAAAEDDEGGEGGLIKTRSMRAQEKAERKSHAITGPVTVDVDGLWAQMTAAPIVPSKTDLEQQQEKENQREDPQEKEEGSEALSGKEKKKEGADTAEPPAMIKIKRTYNFAGKVHTEEKLVSRESAEAKLYLASLGAEGATAAAAVDDADEDAQPKSKPRKAFRSIFEPIVEGLAAQHLQRADLNLGIAARLQLREQQQAQSKAKKLNVVEKSRMDWAGYVDKEGIKDELELAGKSKDSYVHRQDFLARVDANREEDARRARAAGRA